MSQYGKYIKIAIVNKTTVWDCFENKNIFILFLPGHEKNHGKITEIYMIFVLSRNCAQKWKVSSC